MLTNLPTDWKMHGLTITRRCNAQNAFQEPVLDGCHSQPEFIAAAVVAGYSRAQQDRPPAMPFPSREYPMRPRIAMKGARRWH
jgi:hypothetical protein